MAGASSPKGAAAGMGPGGMGPGGGVGADEVELQKLAAKGADRPRPASFCKMFSKATLPELVVFALGVIGTIGHGIAQPIVCLLFGGLIDSMGASTAGSPNWDAMMADIRRLCLQMFLFGVGTIFCAWLQGTCFRLFSECQVKRLRVEYFHGVLHRDVGWFDTQEVAQLPLQISEDIDSIGEAFGDKLGSSLMALWAFLGGYICAFVLGWQVALVMLAILPFMGVGAGLMGKAVQEQQNETQSWYGRAAQVVEECLFAMRTVVAFGGERREIHKFTLAVQEARRGGVRNGFKIGAGMGYTMLIVFCGYALAFYYGSTLRYDGKLNPATGKVWEPGQILAIFFCVFIGSFMVGNIDPGVKAFTAGRSGAGRLFAVLEAPSAIQCKGEDKRKRLLSIESFELREVHFSYPARPDVKVLNGLSLRIPRGQKVAVVGESGSGKSTVISLLERFYDPQGGAVEVNGEDVRNFSVASLRRCIGYVGQEPVLFATSIRENIMQGCHDASPEDLAQACRDAQLTFVEDLPEGLDTFVGAGGSQFSGGQKQRIAIARALLKKANFLFLDEATSALDNRSEKMIQSTIDHISKQSTSGMGIVSIAHRLSTIRNADLIFVLSRGVLVEQGNHATLMAARGLYYALAASQESAAGAGGEADGDQDVEAAGQPEAVLAKEAKGTEAAGDAPQTMEAAQVQQGGQTKQDLTQGRSRKTVAAVAAEKGAEMVNDAAEKEKAREKEVLKTYKVPMLRLLAFNRPEWPFLIPAVVGALLDGASMPVIALVLVESMNAFFYEKEEMRKAMNNICLVYVIIGAANMVFVTIEHGCFAVLGEAMTQRIRVAILSQLFRQEIGFHDDPENSPGMLAKALELYAYRVATFIKTIGNKAAAMSSVVVGLAIAFASCWQMALLMLASVPITCVTQALQMLVMMGATKNENEKLKRAQQIISDSVQNARTVQACGNELDLVKLYSGMVEESMKGFVWKNISSGFAFGVSAGIMFFIMSGGFYFASNLVKSGDTDFGGVMKAFMGIFYAGMGAGQAAAMMGDATKAKVACHDMFKLLDRISAINGLEPTGTTPTTTGASDVGHIEFQEVRFHYPFRPQVKVLKGVNFVIQAGQSVGLVGPSGGGKSTVMALLQRFYDPVDGNVFIGKGRLPLRDLNIRWWRRQVGFVGQEPILFNTTVRANVLYGLDDREKISEERLEQCKKMANLDFLDNQESKGWETEVGPRGARLSGGQKQRVAICRALVRDPPLLLLDEATSALDTQSERVVQEALERARQGRTSFAIAHRLSTIENSDIILVVAEGVVLEKGNHEELMNLGGVYYKLQQQAAK